VRYTHIILFLILTSLVSVTQASTTVSTGSNKPVSSPRSDAVAKKEHSSGIESAKAKVVFLYKKAKEICHNTTTSEQGKLAQLTKLVESSWHISKIAEYVMHPHWKSFSASQKKEFIQLLTDNVVRTFHKVSKKYLSSLKITKASEIKNKKNDYDVYCEVFNKEDNRKVEVRFHIASQKVRNLFVEKLDLVDAKRKDFIALMRKNGQSIPKFLTALHNQSKSKSPAVKST